MEEESFTIKTEAITKECGGIIRWMDGESCIIKGENWHIKAIGNRISFMVMEKFSTTTHLISIVVLTLPILISWKIIGNIMKECLFKIQNKAGER
jgi:hypothetical protein